MIKYLSKSRILAGFIGVFIGGAYVIGSNASMIDLEPMPLVDYDSLIVSISKAEKKKQEIKHKKFMAREYACMKITLIGECTGESVLGKQASGEIIMNRVASKHYPNTVCGAVYQRRQFSMYNPDKQNRANLARTLDIIDNEMSKPESERSEEFNETSALAKKLVNRTYTPILPKDIVNYHTNEIKPDWSGEVHVRIDNHSFVWLAP